MLIGGILLGLVLGFVFGGRLEHLLYVKLRHLPLLFIAVIVRYGLEILLRMEFGPADALRVPAYASAFGLLLFTLWRNREYPGLALAFIGIAMNGLAILANGGRMPVWDAAFHASGLVGEITSPLHYELQATSSTDFLLRLGLLGDIIPIPWWPVNNVASIGDVFLTAGLGFFLFATLVRRPHELGLGDALDAYGAYDETLLAGRPGLAGTARLPHAPGRGAFEGGDGDEETIDLRPGTGLSSALDGTMALERPLMLGAGGIGLASPSLVPLAPIADAAATAAAEGALARTRRSALERIRRHPYVRLALNGSFSALWMGQVISLFGDRVNQIALAALVYEVTKSPLAVALAFVAGTVPNLVLSPIAGAYVDRWDQKQVLIVSDILRASLVLLVPVAILVNVWLAYPLVFLITTVSIFFRPARASVLPRIVPERDLMPANSAMWVAETLADVVNYPLAGLFVVFLAGSLPLAFWFDAVTYLGSAVLLSTLVVPPLLKGLAGANDDETADGAPGTEDAPGAEADEPQGILAELKAGWSFLRNESVLLANTLQGTAGQFSLGVLTVSTFVLAKAITTEPGDAYRATYAFMETAIGVGSLVGGFAMGAISWGNRKGLMVIASYTAFGVLAILIGVVPSVPAVLGFLVLAGMANMAFVIPSQTLFQERTPPHLMGRVVSFRFALVFGGMSIAMALGGLMGGIIGPGPVIVIAGLISVAAGLAGLAFKEVREA